MLSFVDLFCGAGFGARGAVDAGARPLLGVDSWDLATETFRANFPGSEVKSQRVEELDPWRLRNKYLPDVLLASPECTSHSIARGAKPGCERSRETALSIQPWVEAMRPRWLVIENVNRMKSWTRHSELVEFLEDSGYRISDLLLNAADFGAPQSRKRMFLLCDREGTATTRQDLLEYGGGPRLSAAAILDKENRYPSKPLFGAGRAEATIARAERAIQALGQGTPFLIVYYGSDYAGGWQRLDAPLRTVTTLDRFGLVSWSGRTPYLRMLQPDELVRAMCGRSNHLLPHGTRRQKIRLCGNGICAPVTKAIFKRIRHLSQQPMRKAS